MYNLEFIQLGNKHPQTRLPRYNYKIVPNDQKHKPFLEIKKNNKLFKGSKIIAPDINENHFIKSNENDLIQINNPITHEDKIGEEIDQSFVIDFNEENSFDNTNKNKNNIVSQGSVDIFQTHFLNGIYPPNWEKVNTTCGEVWLELFQICRKRNIPNTVLDCLLGWVNKFYNKKKKKPKIAKLFKVLLFKLDELTSSNSIRTTNFNEYKVGMWEKKWHPSSRRGDIEYCSPFNGLII
ncbi:hypothetical protein M0813_25479 [Anaeramoeba flamelloides]|uniref:Uncharacterized protein n=1 Tax=Anaeramoeba flamelloides TaxID=1746091 RepID=A0ABQ8Y234_9EUKA|nr:hypothetical protein M0813_25479 [Anaeramoeba flamelloides]